MLDEHLPPSADERQAAAIAMLQQWMDEDAQLSAEEASANAEVLKAMDRDRPSYRKLFEQLSMDDPK